MAGRAENFGVGEFQSGIKATPKDDAGNETGENQKPQTEYYAWSA
jgi:hypothetical protein